MYEPLTKIDQVILPPEQKEDILTSINVFSAYRSHRRKMDQALSDDRQLVTGLVLMLCGPPGTGKTVRCLLLQPVASPPQHLLSDDGQCCCQFTRQKSASS
jgi:hypothetical protein